MTTAGPVAGADAVVGAVVTGHDASRRLTVTLAPEGLRDALPTRGGWPTGAAPGWPPPSPRPCERRVATHGTTTGITGSLNPDLMPAAYTWHGSASDAYTRATGPQRDAVERISTLATEIDEALTTCAVAGVAFYVALAVVVAQIVASLVAALVAIATGVGAPVGLAGLIASISAESFTLVGAVGTLGAVLAVQAQKMTALHGEAADNSTFPGGHRPDPVTSAYADGTVTDGDADWSLRH